MSRHIERERELLTASKSEPINVLIWGPGIPADGAIPEETARYKKRIQIREQIEKHFPNAEVHFSEDDELNSPMPHLSVLGREAVHAKVSDVVIVLDISRGADLELDHFIPTYPWFPGKVRILLPDKYVNQSGLVNQIFQYLREDQVIGFSQSDFDSCKVASELAVQIALEAAVNHRLTS